MQAKLDTIDCYFYAFVNTNVKGFENSAIVKIISTENVSTVFMNV